MDTEKVKVPLRDDGQYFFDFIQTKNRNKSCGLSTLIGITFLFVLSLSMFILSVNIFIRISKLEKEVELLKIILNAKVNPVDVDLYDDIDTFENEDIYNQNKNDASQTEGVLTGKIDDLEDYNYEYENYDQTRLVIPILEDTTKKILDEATPKGVDYRKETGEGKQLRNRRNVVAATQDGVPINEESYADVKKKNDSIQIYLAPGLSITALPAQPSSIGSLPWPSRQSGFSEYPTYRQSVAKKASTATPPVYNRQSRVMHIEDKSKAFRQVVKKSYLRSGDYISGQSEEQPFSGEQPDFTIVRPITRRPRLGRMKPLTTAHYSGDTSKYVLGQHHNYNGNGHLRHNQKTFVDWKAKSWVGSAGMEQYFEMEDGVVSIKEPGIYFVYAQLEMVGLLKVPNVNNEIYYLDEHDSNGFRVHKNDDILFQCYTTSQSTERLHKGNTCYTAGAEYLSEGDRISIRDLFDGHYTLFEPGKSFFGLIKIGDIKIK